MHGLVWLFTIPFLAAAATPAEVKQAAKSALDDSAIQSEFPVSSAPTATKSDDSHERSNSDWGDVAEVVLWVLVAATLIVVLVWLARKLSGAPPSARIKDDAPTPAEVTTPTDVTLSAANALAAEGKFDEATHVLLQAALVRLDRRAAIPMSMTSREVLDSATLTSGGYLHLDALIDVVERTHFGDAHVDASSFQDARDHYNALVAAEQWKRRS